MLFVLAFDHRNSFRTDFFHIEGELTPVQQARCVEAKLVIVDGLILALKSGLPRSSAGVLVDDEYGTGAALRAGEAGVIVAVPVEKSGRRELEFEHTPFYGSALELAADYVKVLVRYNPEGDEAVNRRQRAKLSEVQDWTQQNSVGFMLELLVPAEPEQLARTNGIQARYDVELRPNLTLKAVRELIAAGLKPALWKLEGMNSREQYQAIAADVRSTRADSGCLVLGRGADEAAVERWLQLAAPVPGFAGFAVGRTIWWGPLRAYYDGAGSRTDAIERIAANYLRLIEVYRAGVDSARG